MCRACPSLTKLDVTVRLNQTLFNAVVTAYGPRLVSLKLHSDPPIVLPDGLQVRACMVIPVVSILTLRAVEHHDVLGAY